MIKLKPVDKLGCRLEQFYLNILVVYCKKSRSSCSVSIKNAAYAEKLKLLSYLCMTLFNGTHLANWLNRRVRVVIIDTAGNYYQ